MKNLNDCNKCQTFSKKEVEQALVEAELRDDWFQNGFEKKADDQSHAKEKLPMDTYNICGQVIQSIKRLFS